MNREEFPNPYNDRALIGYLQAMTDQHNRIAMLGLPDQGDRPDMLMDSIFVQPRLGSRVTTEADESRLREGQSVGAAIEHHRRLAIIGEAGMGKSTLVNYLVYSLARSAKGPVRSHVGALIPLPIVLRDVNLRDRSTEGRWEDLYDRALARLPTSETLKSALAPYLERGQALVLVDGWDEVSVETRRWLSEALDDLRETWPKVRLVLTSRPLGWTEAPYRHAKEPESLPALPPVGTLQRDDVIWAHLRASQPTTAVSELWLLPMSLWSIETYVERWFQLRVAQAHRREDLVKGMLSALRPISRLRYLARVPNLLALMCLVYRVFVHLPSGRGQLYSRIAEAYLESIPVAVKLAELREVPLAEKQRWLGLIAMEMQRTRLKDADRGTRLSRQAAQRAIESGGGIHAEKASVFLDYAARRAGLLLPLTDETLGFTHLSFQEYFAAQYLIEGLRVGFLNPTRAKSTIKELKMQAGHEAGHEVVVVVFEQMGESPGAADALLEQIGGVEGLSVELLAELYYDDATGLTNQTRTEVWKELSEALRGTLVSETFAIPPKWTRTLSGLLSPEEAQSVGILFLSQTQITRLDWIGQFSGLLWLELPKHTVEDISPLRSLPLLSTIEFDSGENRVQRYANDFLKRAALTSTSGIVSLEGLPKWTKLTSLSIYRVTEIINWEHESLLNLNGITIHNCSHLSLTWLSKTSPTTELSVGAQSLEGLTQLSALPNIVSLNLYSPQSDLTPLSNNPHLRRISIHNSQDIDLHPLTTLPNLQSLQLVDTTSFNDTALRERLGDQFTVENTHTP
jgi:hypothetical protein